MSDIEDRLLIQDLMLSYATLSDGNDMVRYRDFFDDVDIFRVRRNANKRG